MFKIICIILNMDLDRINLIKNSSKVELENQEYLENLIITLGFNTEILREQPEVVQKNGGGLLIWQYPNQFSKYLLLLNTLKIESYIEIGCRWGGTFVLTNEYLKTINRSIAVDIIDSPVVEYCLKTANTSFLKMDSQSSEFQAYIRDNFFSLIFIDGDHSYNGVAVRKVNQN
jgi:cephalosporin hydroxylase